MNPNDLLLPPASRLVHIGPHKTGTTSLQQAFHTGRGKLSPHGVHFAGATEQPLLAALAVAGGGGMKGARPAEPEDWTDLVDEVRAAGDQRVVVSSEFLCYADDAAARRVVTEIAGGPVHVVVTLRSIAKIAPSQWQQYVQNGLRVPYLRWLDGMFRRPPYEKPTPSFWRRHSHGDLVRRWAEAVGPENLTVVVADESDPGMLLRTFEAFVGLPDGLLVSPKNAANRSLTRGEIELVRLVNDEFGKHKWSEPWSEDAHVRFVRHGAARRMKLGRRPTPDEPRLAMPSWAAERAAEVGAETVETIKSLGVRVVGDLTTLAEVPAGSLGDEAELSKVPLLPADAAALAVLGAIAPGGVKPSRGAEVAAALAVLGAINVRNEKGEVADFSAAPALTNAINASSAEADLTGLPQIPADTAARAVLGVINASWKLGETDLTGLPQIPADTAALAMVGAIKSRKVPSAKKAAAKKVPAKPVTIEKRVVEKVGARDLLGVVVRRSRRRLRRRLRSR